MQTSLERLVITCGRLLGRLAPPAVLALLAIGAAPAWAQCPPYSPSVSCGSLVVALPYTLDWAADEGGLQDGAAVGTGFTMVDNPSVRLTAAPPSGDGPSTQAPTCLGGSTPGAACNRAVDCPGGGVCAYPGYEPSKLSVSGGALSIVSNKGIQFKCPGAGGGGPACTPSTGNSANTNSMLNGLGVGVTLGTRPIRITTVVTVPSLGASGSNSQQGGISFFTNEDNYVKLAVVASSATSFKVQFLKEVAAASNAVVGQDEFDSANDIISAANVVTLSMVVDPLAGSVSGEYAIGAGATVSLGTLTSALGQNMAPIFAGVDHDSNGGTAPVTFAGLYTTHRNASLTTGLTWAFDSFSIAEEPLRVNFQSPSAPVPAGYVRDFGEPYGLRTLANQGGGILSYGWVTPGTHTPLDLATMGTTPGNGRDRNLVADQRYDTLMHMQADDVAPVFNGNPTEGAWEMALPNGTYQVTVAVGDPSVGADPENHRINVEGYNVIAGFVPSGAAGDPTRQFTATATVTVTDGLLTVDATGGGVNTKIDFIDLVPGGTPDCNTAGDCGAAADCQAYACVAGNCVLGNEAVDTPCDTDGNACTDDLCDGNGMCQHPNAAAGTTCGSASDTECDNPDTCDGAGACQANNEANGTTCTDDGNQCTNDQCSSGACVHPNKAAGAACGSPGDTDCDNPDTCNGSGACQANNEANGTTCTDDGNQCTNDQCSSGACVHPNKAAGAACGSPGDTDCDNPDTCNGSGACQTNNEANGTTCTSDSNPCTVDQCSGGTCAHPAGNAGTVCRASAGECDPQETCTGASPACPTDTKAPNGTACSDDGNQCTNDQCNGSSALCQHPNKTAGAACGSPSDTDCDNPDTCNGSGACQTNNEVNGTACTSDSNPCTVDQCSGGTCAHPAGNGGTVCRVSTGECDPQETCTGASSTCPGDAKSPSGTLCTDDGDICTDDECDGAGVCAHIEDLSNDPSCTTTTSTTTTTGATTSTTTTTTTTSTTTTTVPTAAADHYLCYRTKATAGTPKFTAIDGVSLNDEIDGSATADVVKPKVLCVPADKNAEGIVDAVTHLESYQTHQTSPSVRTTGIQVTNQVGTLSVDTIKADRLLVPTAKNLTTPPAAPPDLQTIGVNHYKCYKMRVTHGTAKFPKGVTVSVADQFTSPAKTLTLKKPKHFCTPVDKNGEGIKNPAAHLLCYKAKPASGAPKHVRQVGVYLADQFGPLQIDTLKEDELCIPSTAVLP